MVGDVGRRDFLKLLGAVPFSLDLLAQEKNADITPVLKEFILAVYESKKKEVDLTPLEQKLSEALKSANLELAVINKIKETKKVPELEEFYKKQGLEFEFIAHYDLIGYQLSRVKSSSSEIVKVFDKEIALETVFVDQVLINSRYDFENKERGALAGSHGLGTSKIRLIEPVIESAVDFYWSKMNETETALRDLLTKSDEWGDLFKRTKSGFQISDSLYDKIAKCCKFSGLEKEYVQGEEKFKKYLKELFIRDIKIHEGMHCADSEHLDKELLASLRPEIRRDIMMLYFMHMEARGSLAQLHHSDNPLHEVGNLARSACTEEAGKIDAHKNSARYIIDQMAKYMGKNKKQFEDTINFTLYTTGHEYLLVKQFFKLKPEQIKAAGKGVLDTIYKGKNLKEYIEWLAK